MSTLTRELPKEVVVSWRKHMGTDHGQYGIDWLRRNYRRTSGETDAQMIKSAAKWEGYMEAMDDIEDRLTLLPTNPQSLDEPTLDTTRDR